MTTYINYGIRNRRRKALLEEAVKRYWILPLIALRSFFKGFVEIVWAIAGMFLLLGLVKYYGQEAPEFVFKGIQIITSNTSLLIVLFAVIFFWFEFLELRNQTRVEK